MPDSTNLRARVPGRFNLIELAVAAALAGVSVWFIMLRRPPEEARWLAERYGPSRNSEYYEEWIIRDYYGDRRDGFFVDVGANHYRAYSNTYYLETSLGWSGIAVEPLSGFAQDYLQHRPRTRFRSFFVSDLSNSTVALYLASDNHLVSSSEKAFTERSGSEVTQLTVPTITLNDLLQVEGVQTIDFMSMDIELHEPKALAGFDIARFKPSLVCIEAHPEVRQAIIDYFTRNGYAVVGRYLRADVHNLYFSPVGAAPRTPDP